MIEAIAATISWPMKIQRMWKLVMSMRRDDLKTFFWLFICTFVSKPV